MELEGGLEANVGANEDVKGVVVKKDDIAESKFVGGSAEASTESIVENAESYKEDDVAETSILGGFADDLEEFSMTVEDNFAETSIVDLADDLAEDNVTERKVFGDNDFVEDNVMMMDEAETVAETSIFEEDNAGEYIFESSFESNFGNDV